MARKLRINPDEFDSLIQSRKDVAKKVTLPQLYKDGCVGCSMSKTAVTPFMEPHGRGEKQILLIGEAPGEQEDITGVPFVGRSGEFLTDALRVCGISKERDCWTTNVLNCRPPNNKFPKNREFVQRCFPRTINFIATHKPRLIICFGYEAVQATLGLSMGITKVTGFVFPSHEHNCYVGCSLHPAFYLRDADRYKPVPDFLIRDIQSALSYYNTPLPDIDLTTGNVIVNTFESAVNIIREFSAKQIPVAFDYETTGLDPMRPDFEPLYVSFADNPASGYAVPLYRHHWIQEQYEAINRELIAFLRSPAPKIAQNHNYEMIVSKRFYKTDVANVVHDTMLAAHVIHQRKGLTGLEFLNKLHLGRTAKSTVDRKSLATQDVRLVGTYNVTDTRTTWYSTAVQVSQMDQQDRMANAHLLKAAKTMFRCQNRGILIDQQFLNDYEEQLAYTKTELITELYKLPKIAHFNEHHGHPFNPGGDHDVITVFKDELETYSGRLTDTNRISTDVIALGLVHEQTPNKETKEAVGLMMELAKVEKSLDTYVIGLRKTIRSDGRIHPSFNLNVAETYRSSSSDPNFQNFPKRDKKQERIRKALIPPPGFFFIEGDVKAAEVRVLAMLSGDEKLIHYVLTNYDFHKEWAAKILEKPLDKVTKAERQLGKNGWVFPCFYGAGIEKLVRQTGITEERAKHWYDAFWEEFSGVRAWQKYVVNTHRKTGVVTTPFGFKNRGFMSPNKVINFPIQCTSFHLLILGMMEAERRMMDLKLESGFVGQIHDSVLNETKYGEEEIVVPILKDSWNVASELKWTRGIPMEMEWKVSFGTWYDLKDTDLCLPLKPAA